MAIGRSVNKYLERDSDGPQASSAGDCHREGFHLGYQQGKAVQEVLRRYVGELHSQRDHASDNKLWSDGEAEDLYRELDKDIGYIEELARLFG